jgi:L-fuculose-phosphate aldolase/L-ribulose-5-phosphate 4-epimerase
MSDYAAQRRELVAAANLLFAEGMQSGTGGNLSTRVNGGVNGADLMVVKARGTSFQTSGIEAAVTCDFSGEVATGSVLPSKESLLHGAIYRRFPAVQAIVHCHSTWSNAWAVEHDVLPCATYHAADKLGGPLLVVDVGQSMVRPEYFDQVMTGFADPERKAVLLRKHGLVAVGASLDEARWNAELVEETAKIALLAALVAQGRSPSPLSFGERG